MIKGLTLRFFSSGDRIRTCDLWVMSPASYRAAPPRVAGPTVHAAGRRPGDQSPGTPVNRPVTPVPAAARAFPAACPDRPRVTVRDGCIGDLHLRRPPPAGGDTPRGHLVLRRAAGLAPRGRRPGHGPGPLPRRRSPAHHLEGPGGAATP